ncbi:MAG: O-methyltransferase [Blastocatellia bacterium]|nr:O-methyltransferase [Blastocatellia bacterium]MCS7157188.1 O-methyltransferase [Blastocatellia bacterium]MCX7752349.1 O-methyltransferase [Blastocatellia bacterium]MDW8167230.1 O-methyltransferase [Acidobacteriota bacterium]
MGILYEDVARYIESFSPDRLDVLLEQEEVAHRRRIPIVGPIVGRWLHQLARMIGARRIFEMGSAIGYSTIWLALAVPEDGVVYYTDNNPTNAREALGYFRRAGVADRVRILVGDALLLLDQVEGQFDLIFNDVDKHQYPDVFRKAVPRLRRGGLLVADNVLWSGRVARGETDRETAAIREFNRLLFSSPDLLTTIIPLRDGLSVSLKL